MIETVALIIIFIAIALVYKFSRKVDNKYTFGVARQSRFDKEAVTWCAEFLSVDEKVLRKILNYTPSNYNRFKIGKRSGGYRTISAPNETLLTIQKNIYRRLLYPVNLHPAATGFINNKSIADNASPHLKNDYVLKVDIMDFFGSINKDRIVKIFETLGHSSSISKVLAQLCCLHNQLPQGAATSPVLSNLAAQEMDNKLAALAQEYQLVYTRYADDITFSGDNFPKDVILNKIIKILQEEGFKRKMKKTRYLMPNRRKIITGISISSGEKMTIPKAVRREIRKNVHYIITRGLSAHLQHIDSKDPVYLKRLIGQLSFWKSVEPDNTYVIKSLEALKKIDHRMKQ